ncbi:MAG: hypothetical protein F4052_08490 [Dehalococcoidia bacterium]|nr:hypothetical protein [Dehalococcoidia bacterium]MYK26964.1 hypothetical protein [Dehalococcoidia bacterium]
MACQVGITTDPDRRRSEWERDRPRLSHWRLVSTHRSKSAAQRAEIDYAERNNCNYGVGGAGPEVATWYVYRFSY